MVMMEEKLVINELQQGKELANRLMSNLKHSSSSSSSSIDPNNKILISEILRIYQNAILMLSLPEDDDKKKNKNILKRSSPEIENKDSSKKRKMLEKKTEKVRVFVGTEHEKGFLIDDGYSWRKYGQKEIQGSKNPRRYYRCTHRFTQDCLATKQVQKSDKDPSIYEVKYLGEHTCNNNTSPKTNTNFSVSVFVRRGNRVNDDVTEDIKPEKKTEETIISLEDLENKKDIFRTFSFSNHEIGNALWKDNILTENSMENLSPETSGSGITSEFVRGFGYVENSETADSYFSSLDNIIDLGQDWLWS